MARLTRQEKAAAIGAGLLLGTVVALISQVLGAGLTVDIPLCILLAAGLGAALATGKRGIW